MLLLRKLKLHFELAGAGIGETALIMPSVASSILKSIAASTGDSWPSDRADTIGLGAKAEARIQDTANVAG